jgi:hypothetical protein
LLVTQAHLSRESIARALFADDAMEIAKKQLQKILSNRCVSPADGSLVINAIKNALKKRRSIDLVNVKITPRNWHRLQTAYGFKSQPVLCNALKMPELGYAAELPPKAWFALMRLITKIERKSEGVDREIQRIHLLTRAAKV